MSSYTYCPRCATALSPKERGGLNRLVCPACGWVHWDNPTPVVAAIVQQRDHIILVQSIGWPDSWYGLVTGFLEKEEHPAQAALREVKEELGLNATLQSFVGLYPFAMRNQIIMTYHVIAEDSPIQLDQTELQAYKSVSLHKIKPWPTATGIALQDWMVSQKLWPREE